MVKKPIDITIVKDKVIKSIKANKVIEKPVVKSRVSKVKQTKLEKNKAYMVDNATPDDEIEQLLIEFENKDKSNK